MIAEITAVTNIVGKIVATFFIAGFFAMEAFWPIEDQETPLSWKIGWGIAFAVVMYFLWR